MTQILMQGYYGKRNFGDDVLMVVTYRLLKEALPHATMSMVADKDSYIKRLLPDVMLISSATPKHYDMIIHGGGGVFFDFAQYGFGQRVLEILWRVIGFRQYVTAENIARRLLHRPRNRAAIRLGLGIGVGYFTPGSPRLRRHLHTLADFAALWVRDAQSIDALKQFNSVLRAPIIQGSDLAFLTHYWKPAVPPRMAEAKPKLGIVLRDWKGTDYTALKRYIASLNETYTITGFIFDETSDPRMMELLADYPTHIWRPEAMSIEEFATTLATQDVLLTSRAHGAICGACLGVPSLIVEIEPKLAQVHAMLHHSSMIVAAHDMQQWHEALGRVRNMAPKHLQDDVAHNTERSQQALAHIKQWFA